MILSLTGALPQLVSSTKCLPRHRPLEVIGVSLACSPNTRPISRSPSATADVPASTTDSARTPNGKVPLRVWVPAGGENTTTAVASWSG